MSSFINGCHSIFWCNCNYVWWCSESNLSHHSDDLCKRFNRRFILWIGIHQHRHKLNRTSSMVISRYQYQNLTKVIFPSPEICGNILSIFGVGLKPPILMRKINWYTWSWIFFLEMVVCGCLCILLGIYDIGITEDKDFGIPHIPNGGSEICHCYCKFEIDE